MFLFVVNETFDAVFDTENAESDEDALVNQVYDEIGLEFSESVRNYYFKVIFIILNNRLRPLHQNQLRHQKVNLQLQMKKLIDFWHNTNNKFIIVY